MFSEDDFFCKVVHETIVKDLKWYSSSRSFNDLTLGGLIVLILLKTIQHNVSKAKDRYLQTNCLATLANLSSNFKQLHPYVCQQLIGLMEQLCKRHSRLLDAIGFVNANEFDSKDALNNENLQSITALEEAMRMLMEILNSCLTNNLRHNPHLIYTMLYERHLFDNFQNHPMFQDLSWNIGAVLNHFSTRVSSLEKGSNVGEVLAVIQQGALQWPTDRLKRFPELKFKYVEDTNTEEFFVPYVWSLLIKYSGFYWDAVKIKLFEARVICRDKNIFPKRHDLGKNSGLTNLKNYKINSTRSTVFQPKLSIKKSKFFCTLLTNSIGVPMATIWLATGFADHMASHPIARLLAEDYCGRSYGTYPQLHPKILTFSMVLVRQVLRLTSWTTTARGRISFWAAVNREDIDSRSRSNHRCPADPMYWT
uniref:Dymeclin n=1 Tax=Romanomermis culicivorax TaxID=13658 RepID=A0A915HY00_ROMCU